ncbi:MAG: hypothetical protein JNL81_01430 [Hyphomonadaceae bacterium]|nr:hypothetical protein [Hyphomonadaceae bacterium]
MKRFVTAVALGLALSSFAPVAMAQEQTQFRSAEARAFSTEELQQYGLSAEDSAQVAAYQEQGYNVVVMTPEEAAQYEAGMTTTHWLLIGLLVVVVVVAAT